MGRAYSRPLLEVEEEENKDDEDKEEEEDTFTLEKPQEEPESPMEKLSFDPWDSQLLFAEPQPDYYATFEEYEEALRNWSKLCVDNLQFIPPHATQFEELIGLIPHEFVEGDSGDDNEDNAAEIEAQSGGPRRVHYLVTKLNDQQQCHPKLLIPPQPPVEETEWVPKRGKEWKKLNGGTKLAIRDVFQDWVSKVEAQKSVLPIVHGTFAKNAGNDVGGLARSSTISKKLARKTEALRRTDLNPKDIEGCRDAPSYIANQDVFFITPNLELEEPFSYAELTTTYPRSQYNATFANQWAEIDQANRHDSLNGWVSNRTHPCPLTLTFQPHTFPLLIYLSPSIQYHPTTPLRQIKQYLSIAKTVVGEAEEITVETIERIVEVPMYLDHFQQFLQSTDESDDEAEYTYMQTLAASVTTENVHSLLGLFDIHKDKLIRAKLATFVMEIMQTCRAKHMLEELASTTNVEGLYWVAFSMNYHRPTNKDIFPYIPENWNLLADIAMPNTCIRELLQKVFTLYYLNVINDAIMQQTYLYVAINYFVAENMKRFAADIASTLSETPDIGPQILIAMQHRSSTISSLALFVMLQFIHNPNQDVQAYLLDEESQLLEVVRSAAASKFGHVQFACRRLFASLTENASTFKLISAYYSQSGTIINDLMNEPNRTYALDGSPPLLCELLSEYLISSLQNPKSKTIEFLMGANFFTDGIKQMMTLKNKLCHGALAISHVLMAMAKHMHTIDRVEGSDPEQSVKSSARKAEQQQAGEEMILIVSYSDIRNILTVIKGMPDKGYAIKRFCLGAVRHLLKVSSVFDLVQMEPEFYTQISSFCREGRTFQSMHFNREAWRLFFQIIRYHSGTINYMQKSNQLAPFLDTIGGGSGAFGTMNGLHYLAKLLDMPDVEKKRISNGKKPSRSDSDMRGYENDVKSLVNFLVSNSQFIKIHMIYKRYFPAISLGKRPDYPGFHKVAEIYNIINESAGCSRLLRDAYKNGEYKNGLQHIAGMYGGSEEGYSNTSSSSSSGSTVSSSVGSSKGSTSSTSSAQASATSSGKSTKSKKGSRFGLGKIFGKG
eukprot:TRINITY_DN5137_c0_g1_i1.p1 TRINITY_DN5137_c0_g1~~TRINITY_DN5137_c0_g1_i1.p1  ORF type:complete len:1062 (+),score=341.53 TRINITY_DN5137_c0_g1_i1:875-4060(+)